MNDAERHGVRCAVNVEICPVQIPRGIFWCSWMLLAGKGGYSLSAASLGSTGHTELPADEFCPAFQTRQLKLWVP